ncbi:MAG: response regulator receiver modulated diguanylate cyclase/phosphodiesterase with PAS/PAC sensor(s) [Magnetococcales bacterium]|nr:response regulator receiver modulated diguanylate cyclase/phosphodiesterase with PAS/PAC sensor(s) [Magnetococcales bacterium]HIJ84060.1 EAL domain-containing protein [Magnetococcales bacterium]
MDPRSWIIQYFTLSVYGNLCHWIPVAFRLDADETMGFVCGFDVKGQSAVVFFGRGGDWVAAMAKGSLGSWCSRVLGQGGEAMNKKPLFYVVDDDAITRLTLCRFLENQGYATVRLESGQAALEELDRRLPDIILLDARMPGLDGFATLAAIKEKEGAQRIPVLMITGLNDDESVDRAYEQGAVDFITKPIHWAILRNRVTYLLREIDHERRLYLAASVFDNTTEGIVVTDMDATIQSVNPAFTRITGYTSSEVVGSNMRVLRSGQHDRKFYTQFWESLQTTGKWQGEFQNRHKDGSIISQWATISSVIGVDGQVERYVCLFSDLTALRESEANFAHLSGHDSLTDLPNRHLFQARLALALAENRESSLLLGVMVLDIDRFKVVNDTLGHDKGDQLLIRVSRRLRKALPRQVTMGRLGGDAFGFILPDLQQSADAAKIAQTLLDALGQPFVIDGNEAMEFFVGASVGIGVSPLDGVDVKTLLRNTDAAMYHAKEQGRNNFQFYRNDLNIATMARMLMESSLRSALEKGEFVLYYQPQVDAITGELTGAEALIRWQHPLQGMIAPGEFIPLAEDTGLIIPIGQWALQTACDQMALWCQKGLAPLRVAVNLSGIQFKQPDFSERVLQVVRETGVEPQWLELELTETIAMGDVEETYAKLKILSEGRIQLAIDDFGTGFSSLSYLRRFPIDTLKIDRSFVRNCVEDADDATIVRTFIGLAHSLGLSVVAEGVETREQWEFLKREGCDCIQGYYFGRPLSPEAFEDIMREMQTKRLSAGEHAKGKRKKIRARGD